MAGEATSIPIMSLEATTQGAIFAIVLGIGTWLVLLLTPAGEAFPAQLGGFLASAVGMLVGSLGPQGLKNRQGSHHRVAGLDKRPA